MNLKDLSRILSKEYHLSSTLTNQILKTILKTIVSELSRPNLFTNTSRDPDSSRKIISGKKGGFVRLRNFGTFQAKKSHGKLRAKFDDSKNFFNST